MSILRLVVFDLLLAVLSLPFIIGFLYLANFQRTILLVGKKLAPEKGVLVPDELRRAITPRHLSLLTRSVYLAFGAILLWGIFSLEKLAVLLAAFFIGALYYFMFFGPVPYVPKPGARYYVDYIRNELEKKRRRYVGAGNFETAEKIAEWQARLDSIRNQTGAIDGVPDWDGYL